MACWTEGTEKLQPGPFSGGVLCSCQDSTNNTYACVRRVNGGYSVNYKNKQNVVVGGKDNSNNKNFDDVADLVLANNFLYCQFNDNDSLLAKIRSL